MKKTILLMAHLLSRRACLWAALGLLAALAVRPPPAQAAVTEAGVHRYGNVVSNSYDQAFKVVSDAAGDIIVTGSTRDGIHGSDMLTIKYSGADGSVLWQQRSTDYTLALAVDGSANVVATGSSVNSGGNADYYTAKYAAADGALLWERRYNGGTASSLALGPNGMVAVTGTSSGDYATVVYRDDVYPISIALVPTGVRLRFIGIPGHSYTIERAPAVTGPWTPINTQAAPASGLFEYIDTAPPPGSAFYRTVQP